MEWNVFFGPDNDEALRWATLSVPGSKAALGLRPFIDLVDRRAPVAALPRIRSGSTTLHWYVGWRTDSDARFAQDLLCAFLGRTYADLKDPIRLLEPADPAELAFASEFEGRAFRIEVSWDRRKDARRQLLRMAQGLLQRPDRRAGRVRPVGRILRDFELALQAGNDATARTEIDTLRDGGHLDETNLAFLELRRLGATRAWSVVLSHESLPSLLGFASLPWQVRSVLLEAIFHEHLAEPVAGAKLDEALGRIAAILPVHKVVFGSRRYIVEAKPTLCFLLADALQADFALDEDDRRLAELEATGFAGFVKAFRDRFGSKQRPSAAARSLEDAQRAIAEAELDRAFAIAEACDPSIARTRLLLQCARLLDTEVAAVTAISACDQLNETERTEVLSFGWCRSAYEHLARELGTPPLPALPVPQPPATTESWMAWFARLRQSTPWPGAVSRASTGATEWDVQTIAADADKLSDIVGTLGANLASWAADALRQSLPYLLDAFLYEPPDPRLASLAEALFELLATDDAISSASASALVRLAQHYLATKPSAYVAVVDTVASTIERVASPKAAGLIAEALEMLVTTPAGTSQTTLENAAIRISAVAGRYWMRLDAVHRALIRRLGVELNAPDVLPPDPSATEDTDAETAYWGATLAGRSIALYSLTQSALDRSIAALEAACPGARFKGFCEEGGTVPMRDAARTADLFVIATRSAKHAATDFIMQHRDGPVAYAGGKGSTTLIDAVRLWAEGGAPR